MAADMELEGIGEVMGKLKSLKGMPKKKPMNFALRKAANIVRDNVHARAQEIDDPKTPTSIAENVVARADAKHFKQTGDLKFSVGIRGGSTSKAKNASNPGGDTWYWRFVEMGTEKMAATPFMRPGMEESITPATKEFTKQLGKAIDRAIKRAAKGK